MEPKKEKLNRKKVSVSFAILITTALVGGSVWYYMNLKLNDKTIALQKETNERIAAEKK